MLQTMTNADAACEVRAAMARACVSNSELAKRLGKDQGLTSRKVRGLVPITVAELVTIAAVLGVPAATLLPAEPTKAAS